MGDGWAPTELLGRLAAKGPQYSMAPGGSPKYTMEDIAGALAGLPYPVYCYARAKYCGDARNIKVMVDETRRALWLLARREKWRVKDCEHFVDAVADMALNDALSPSICRSCKGTGRRSQSQQCGTCRGSGMREVEGHKAAASRCHPDMTQDAWRKNWRLKYLDAAGMIDQWESRITAHLFKHLIEKRRA